MINWHLLLQLSFNEARAFVDMGIKLLEDEHWEKQYSLSLQLFELSASLSCMCGDKATMKICLSQIIAHIASFEDSLKSSLLLAKLLVSQSQFTDAMGNCLDVLKNLGETFSDEVALMAGGTTYHGSLQQELQNELSVIQSTLANITVEQVKSLPPMTDKRKLNAMAFLSLLCTSSVISQPMLSPILSCRMVRLTIENGYCDETIGEIILCSCENYLFSNHLGYFTSDSL